MFNRLSSLILAILLFAILAGSANNFYVFAVSLAILLVASFSINLKRVGLSWPHLLLPVFFLLGIGGVFVIITTSAERNIFLLAASVVFYLLESNLGKESHLLQNIYLFSVFSLFLGLFSAQFYFHLPTVLLVAATYLISHLLIVQGYAGFSLPAKKYFHILTGLACAEVAWGLTFWPTHYFVDAVVLFCVFYLIWIFSFSAFFGKLTWKKAYWQLGLVGLALLITLTSAAWRPLVK
ncbi:MAG: hypothetical protein ACM3NH_01105 [Candidatus Saccharibacteria bacterium]